MDRKVVVIDDDKKFLGELKGNLTASGYKPVIVNNALLAVDMVVKNVPDVILMELSMPRKSGIEIADIINRIFKTKIIPIIAMSAFFKNEIGRLTPLLEFCGIRGCLKKPFQPIDVIWAIENVIKGR